MWHKVILAMWPIVCCAVGQCKCILHCLHMIFPNLEANKFLIAKWACLPAALHAPHQHMCQSLGQPYNVGAQPRPHASPTYPTAAAHTCPCCENEAALCGDGGGAAHLLWSLHRPTLCRRGLSVRPTAVLTTTHLHKQLSLLLPAALAGSCTPAPAAADPARAANRGAHVWRTVLLK